jgi:hypothetical protein
MKLKKRKCHLQLQQNILSAATKTNKLASFVKRPTNAQGSRGFFINTLQIPTPTCFGIWLPSSRGRECLISYSSNVLCYGSVRIMTRPVWPVVVPR